MTEAIFIGAGIFAFGVLMLYIKHVESQHESWRHKLAERYSQIEHDLLETRKWLHKVESNVTVLRGTPNMDVHPDIQLLLNHLNLEIVDQHRTIREKKQ